MSVFVIDRVVRRRPLGIQPQHYVILLPIAVKQSRRTYVLLSAPLLRRQHLHRCFIARRQYHDRLPWIDPQFLKCRVE